MKLSDLLLALESPEKFAWIDTSTGCDLSLTLINESGSFSSDSKFFLGGFEFGPSAIVHVESYRGDGFEQAYEAWVDSLPTIPDEELVEAYGMPGSEHGSFLDDARAAAGNCPTPWHGPEADAWSKEYRLAAKRAFDAAIEDARDSGDYPELIEGYRENSNGAVVDLGHYEQFQEADLDCIVLKRLCDKHDDCKSNREMALECAASSES